MVIPSADHTSTPPRRPLAVYRMRTAMEVSDDALKGSSDSADKMQVVTTRPARRPPPDIALISKPDLQERAHHLDGAEPRRRRPCTTVSVFPCRILTCRSPV